MPYPHVGDAVQASQASHDPYKKDYKSGGADATRQSETSRSLAFQDHEKKGGLGFAVKICL